MTFTHYLNKPSQHFVLYLILIFGTGVTLGCELSVSSLPCPDIQAGELLITEILANPAGEDGSNEYIELYNASQRSLDLRGLRMRFSTLAGNPSHIFDRISLDAGDYLVLSNAALAQLPAHADYSYAADLGDLRNAGGEVELYCDATRLEYVAYPESKSGRAWQRDATWIEGSDVHPARPEFCEAQQVIDETNFGSPGASNEICVIPLELGECREQELPRAIRAPTPGEVIINEVMMNPVGSDSEREWFELYALEAFDLNGILAGRSMEDLTTLIKDDACIPVSTGSYLLFAKSNDPELNGLGIIPDAVFRFSLLQSNGSLLLSNTEEPLDSLTWISSEEGISKALDPAFFEAEQEIRAQHFCASANEGGTPLLENLPCP